jgi:tRNA(adenine34) deaminase
MEPPGTIGVDDAMQEALRLARDAAARGEVPVGAVALCDGRIVGRGVNAREADRDPTAHAELLAIQAAARTLGRWRLTGVTLVVTLEPCAMCAGALVLARIDRLVFGASDPKAGAVGSLFDLSGDARLNHRFEVERGVRAEESAELLREFFRARRGERRDGEAPAGLGNGPEIG